MPKIPQQHIINTWFLQKLTLIFPKYIIIKCLSPFITPSPRPRWCRPCKHRNPPAPSPKNARCEQNVRKRQPNNRSFHTYSINVSWSLRTVQKHILNPSPLGPSLTVRQRTVVVTASEDMVLDPMDAVVARGGLLSDKLWWLRREDADRGGQNQAQEFKDVYISCVWYNYIKCTLYLFVMMHIHCWHPRYRYLFQVPF